MLNMTQMIEKKREHSSLQNVWNKGEILTCAPEENKVYDNCFTTSAVPVSGIKNSEGFSSDKAHLMKFNSNQTELIKINPGKIDLDETKSAKKDLKTIVSDPTNINSIYRNITEFENGYSEIKHFKAENLVCSSNEGNGQKTYIHEDAKNKTMHVSLEHLKRSETNQNDDPEIIKPRDDSAMSSGNAREKDMYNIKSANKDFECRTFSYRTKKIESEMNPLATVEELMEIDEVDYYDSEDEFWNTHDVDDYQNDYVDDNQSSTASIPTSGRYSKGVEQLRNLTVFRRSIRDFAVDNNFEVHDVIPDGNCMFRALSDQLMINGFPGHTEASLRNDSITYLRSKPFKDDGGHESSFLSGETWEEYLNRMERSREWGDHIVLQALVDVYCLQVIVFNVFQEDIRRTEVIAESDVDKDVDKDKRLTVFLGHLGEFHYLSLRPKNWFEQWPYKALLCRLLVCSTDPIHGGIDAIMRKRMSNMKPGKYISNSELVKISEFVSHMIRKGQTIHRDPSEKLPVKGCIFISFSGQDLQLEDTEDLLACLLEDPLLTDPVSGIPLPHLSTILRHLVPDGMMIYLPNPPCTRFTTSHYTGSVEDGTDLIRLRDFSRSQEMSDFYKNERYPKHLVFLKDGLEATLFEDAEMSTSSSVIYIDTSKTKPGYCRLVFPDDFVPETDKVTLKTESGLYLTGFNVPDLSSSSYSDEMTTVGIRCAFHAVGKHWLIRRKHFDFPSSTLQLLIVGMNCTLVPGAHHQSENPAIEWKFNFSRIESVLMECLSLPQRYGFKIFKILLDNMTFHLTRRLKTKHLKAVFLQVCEEFPSTLWNSNLGGCILFLLNKLLSCLRRRFLPHYFIPQRNLIDHFPADDIDTLCVIVESVRAFPVHVSQFVAEKHGIAFGKNLVRSILVDTVSFAKTRDLDQFINRVLPETYRTAKFFSRLGFYWEVFYFLMTMQFTPGIKAPTGCYDFLNDALQHMKQRSTRIILAKIYEKKFGTKLTSSFLEGSKQSLEKKHPWCTDYQINWLEVPEDKDDDLVKIADFLYEHSVNEYHKRNATLAAKFINTAILCIKKAVEEDSIDVKTIEDTELKHEILEQRRELRVRLKNYYLHVLEVTILYRDIDILYRHIIDIMKLSEHFPEMKHDMHSMARYLNLYDIMKEYAEKLMK